MNSIIRFFRAFDDRFRTVLVAGFDYTVLESPPSKLFSFQRHALRLYNGTAKVSVNDSIVLANVHARKYKLVWVISIDMESSGSATVIVQERRFTTDRSREIREMLLNKGYYV